VNVGLPAQGTNPVICGRLSDLYRRNIVRRVEETFWVRGEVRYPNLHYVYGTNRSWTVLGAIDAAGGFTAKARKDQVWVRSFSGSLSRVNCLSARTNAQEDKVVAPGGGIYVPRAGF
jgi:protein involved in polysaccharide export with SLBB domain